MNSYRSMLRTELCCIKWTTRSYRIQIQFQHTPAKFLNADFGERPAIYGISLQRSPPLPLLMRNYGGRMKRDVEGDVSDLVWNLVFRELGNEEMVQLAYEIVQCSMMDRECRDRALEALGEVVK